MRQRLDLDLDPSDALARIEASFRADKGWKLTRHDDASLLVETASARGHVFDPIPAGRAMILPETLALRVEVEALADGGCRVEARIVRTRVLVSVAAFAGDLVSFFGFGTLLHAAQLVEYRRERRGGKRRLLRLAIEPLLAHVRAPERGPFRSRAREPGDRR